MMQQSALNEFDQLFRRLAESRVTLPDLLAVVALSDHRDAELAGVPGIKADLLQVEIVRGPFQAVFNRLVVDYFAVRDLKEAFIRPPPKGNAKPGLALLQLRPRDVGENHHIKPARFTLEKE